MKITKINVFIILLRLLTVLMLITMIVIVPFLPTENSWVVFPIIGILLFLLFTFMKSMFLDTINIYLKEDSIELSRFLGYQHQVLRNNEIRGFSDSEIELGRSRRKVKSLIIYTNNNEAFELIRYNYLNFEEIRDRLNRFEYLGEEPYQTGWMYRKYKFTDEHKIH